MKAHHSLLLASALLAAPTVALSGEPTPVAGSVGNVTIALTFSFTAPNTFAKGEDGKVVPPPSPVYENFWQITSATKTQYFDEYLSKMKAVKYGNKEFLEDLIEAGILPDEGVIGWSIIQVTPTEDESPTSSFARPPEYFAVRANTTAVNITPVWNTIQISRSETETYKSIATVPNPPANVTVTVTDTLSWKAAVPFAFDFDPPQVTGSEELPPKVLAQGLFTGSRKQVYIGTGDHKRPVQLLGAQKIDKVHGAGPFLNPENGPEDDSVVEGAISISPGKAVNDLTTPYGIMRLPPEDV